MVMYLMGGSITSQWGKRFLLSDVGLGTTLTVVAVQDSANAKFRGKKKKKKNQVWEVENWGVSLV